MHRPGLEGAARAELVPGVPGVDPLGEAAEGVAVAVEVEGVPPEEVAEAFDTLYASGKVRAFGVSNHTPGQIELLRPKIIMADEPVSMVDASLRATILDELRKLNTEFDISLLYITLPMASQPRILQILDALKDTTASIYFVPDMFITDLIQGRSSTVCGMPVISVCETPFTGANGVINVLYGYNVNSKISGSTVLLTPSDRGGSMEWDCTSGNIANRYLPTQCR